MKCSGQVEEPVKRDKREKCHYTFYKTGLIYAFFCFHLVFPIRSHHVVFSSPEHKSAHGELLWSVNVRRPSFVVRRAASTIALKAYSSYTLGPIDSILGRKHQGDLLIKNS